MTRDRIAALASWRAKPVLLAFDFDGTLAPIVGNRDEATMRPSTRALLARVGTLYPVAIISGRARRDVATKVQGTGAKHVIGNHGNEPAPNLAELARVVAEAREVLVRELTPESGVSVEDKLYSLSLHYRHAPDSRVARKAIARALAHLPVPMRVIGGKRVVNLVPEGARHKGDVVRELCASEPAEAALYVGDDVTDEDVFAHVDRTSLVGVRVGRSERSAAEFYLKDQREIDDLLVRLIELRSAA